MRSVLQCTVTGLLLASVAGYAGDVNPYGWKRIFDGKTLNGWKANERPENWTVETHMGPHGRLEGELVGQHGKSYLFYMDEMCENCEFYAEIKLNHGGNSGMYFRVQEFASRAKGYEAQLNSTDVDPARTGSLLRLWDVTKQLIPDDKHTGTLEYFDW